MRYPLERLVRLSRLPVDTIRYYQSIGLLHRPAHEGRHAYYDRSHLTTLRRIRRLSSRGLPLKVIRQLLSGSPDADSDKALLAALRKETAAPRYTRAKMAALLGIPQTLLRLVERHGLLADLKRPDGSIRYSEADLEAARRALRLLRHGFPVTRLLALAARHDRAMRETVDQAIEMFNDYVRKTRAGDGKEDMEAVARAFEDLLPLVTSLVAYHFQRLLISRALRRLESDGDHRAFEVARRVASELEVEFLP